SCFSGRLSLAAVAALMLGATALSPAAHAQSFSGFGGFGGTGGFRPPPTNPPPGGSPPPGGTSQATDPGPRGGTQSVGGPLKGLSQNEVNFFSASKDIFNEVDGVPQGLGPRFNMDSCGGCHAFPAAGGSSPPSNPQVAVATAMGAKNTLPSFITANG